MPCEKLWLYSENDPKTMNYYNAYQLCEDPEAIYTAQQELIAAQLAAEAEAEAAAEEEETTEEVTEEEAEEETPEETTEEDENSTLIGDE